MTIYLSSLFTVHTSQSQSHKKQPLNISATFQFEIKCKKREKKKDRKNNFIDRGDYK